MEQKIDKGLNWVEKTLDLVNRYKIWDFIKAIFVILLIAGAIGFISHPTWIFEQYKKWEDDKHKEHLEQRLLNNEKAHILTEKLMYRVNADRVMVLEMHNGLENSNGLPFSKCSATYEAMNSDVMPVACQYQNVNLSLMPFANHMMKTGYWYGNVDDMETIDRALYYKLKSNGTEHFACVMVEGVDKPLAFIFVSFRNLPDKNHDCNTVRENIRHISLELALLLEINKLCK